MTNKRLETEGSKAMDNIAKHYADELDSKFRTLNEFVHHAGEIGRAHELFLKSIIMKILPKEIRVDSGFIVSPKWTSRQQDIILHLSNYPAILEIGDCKVIDHLAFVGAIEVKTKITSKTRLIKALETQALLREQIKQQAFFGIYSWESFSTQSTLDSIWEYVRKSPIINKNMLPDVIYARGKYFLKTTRDTNNNVLHYTLLEINKNGITDGQALLGIVASIFEFGLSKILPWWLLSWHDSLGLVAGRSKIIKWPEDLVSLKK